MKKLDLAVKLEQVITSLREKRELLELDMQNITEELHKGKFVNTLLHNDLYALLEQVDSLQGEAYALTTELGLGEVEEDSLDKLEVVLHGYKAQLEAKAALEPIVAFVRNLNAKNPEVQQILLGLRQEVAALDFDELSLEELQQALHKYVLLKEAFDMKDSFQRFQKVMKEELNGLFDLRLLFQLTQMNDLYLANDPLHVEGVQEELDFEEKKTEFLTSEAENPAVEEEAPVAAENPAVESAPLTEGALYLGANEPIYSEEDWRKEKRFSANSFKREIPDALSAMVFQFIGEYFFFSFKSLKKKYSPIN